MTATDWIGAIGVTLLLMAYLLNLSNRLRKDGFIYLMLNLAGAGLACLAAVLIRYLPFVILEGCWALVSAVGLFNYFTKPKQ